MQLGRTRISPEERQRGYVKGAASTVVNRATSSPVKDRAHPLMRRAQVSKLSSAFPPRTLTQVTFSVQGRTVSQGVLIDSGADESFMDWTLARLCQVKSVPLTRPVNASALDGCLLFKVTHRTEPIQVTLNDTHTETTQFHLFDSALHPLVLGFPWLEKHNPHIDWRAGTIRGWGDDCLGKCFSPHLTPTDASPAPGLQHQDSGNDSGDPDLTNVPSCYHDLKDVFNTTKAVSLPPHRMFDCAIDLLPGAPIPKGRLYSISRPEREAMDNYISTYLEVGLIRPSSSPAGAGFFFVDKKDGSLRQCIDYSPLNNITLKNRYPLPLISSAFELLQTATIFTKLYLRNAYHLIRIREGEEWKTGFNTPSGHYEYLVMPFGLCNAPSVFQNFVNEVLREFLNAFVFVYRDDISIFSPDPKSHVGHVRQVLQKLLENQLYVKAEKCDFHAASVSFLGYIVSANQVKMDPSKVSAVAN